MSRKTVNWIKMRKEVDDKTRHQISRAGDIEAQILKAAELNVLDDAYYLKVIRGLKNNPKFGKIMLLISMYCIYGFSLFNLGKYALYVLL